MSQRRSACILDAQLDGNDQPLCQSDKSGIFCRAFYIIRSNSISKLLLRLSCFAFSRFAAKCQASNVSAVSPTEKTRSIQM